jgi:hypothetical protein
MEGGRGTAASVFTSRFRRNGGEAQRGFCHKAEAPQKKNHFTLIFFQ